MLRVSVLRLYALMLFCIMSQVTVCMVLQRRLDGGSIETVKKSPSNNAEICVKFVKVPNYIKAIGKPIWLESWDDAEFNTECNEDYNVTGLSGNVTLAAMQYAYSHLSGQFISDWSGLQKRDDQMVSAELLTQFWNDDQIDLEKRWWKFYGTKWIKSNLHKAKGYVLATLATTFSGCGSYVMQLGRLAYCTKRDGNQGCVSWSGGGHTMQCHIAAQAINEARGYLGEFGDLSAHAKNAFLDSHNHVHSMCVSNRPNGCK